jgi:hypothetical protein
LGEPPNAARGVSSAGRPQSSRDEEPNRLFNAAAKDTPNMLALEPADVVLDGRFATEE